MSNVEDPVVETPENVESTEVEELESDLEVNAGLDKALATYRK
ncbi:MAG: DNA-directed RNA polymerase subunit K, partial [Nitrosopumilaceae archaeon]|nr:DNA-directed RNA polymerase subunit K [Nitrosopumilaceae archaeon]